LSAAREPNAHALKQPVGNGIGVARCTGRTVVHVARAGKLIGLIAIADAPRPTAAATVE
jgi:P-type Cu2+ transporter